MPWLLGHLGLGGVDPLLAWSGLVILGFPLLTFLAWEASRRLAEAHPEAASWLGLVQRVLLPVLAAWVILRRIADIAPDGWVAPVLDTLVAGVLIYVALGMVQLLLLANRDFASRAPKLLIDLCRLMLAAFGVALVISDVWDVDLAGLVTALGVGSVVIGLALQGVVGGIVHGVILVSGRHFAIGDVLRVGEATGRVVQIDWLAVTLESDGQRVVIPSGDLAQKSFTVLGPAGNPRRAEVTLEIGYTHPPERVRAALLHAALRVPQRDPARTPVCRITGYGERGLRYAVTLPLAAPLTAGSAQDELLSRFWYLAQREGIGLTPEAPEPRPAEALPGATAEARAAMLARNGALGMPGLPLAELAGIARYARYRPGEALVEAGEVPTAIFAVEQGEIAVTTPVAGTALAVQRLAPGDLFAARAAFRGDRSGLRAEAVGEVAVLALPVLALQPLLGRNPALARIVEMTLEAGEEAEAKVLRPARGRAPGGQAPARDVVGTG